MMFKMQGRNFYSFWTLAKHMHRHTTLCNEYATRKYGNLLNCANSTELLLTSNQ